MDVRQNFIEILKEAGLSKITRSSYDTAWIARLGEIDRPLSLQALNWISENQLSDGSWGASAPYYYHDRIICTLAAITALATRGRRTQDRRQIERGQQALELLGQGATRGLVADPGGATVGFEMLMPTLLAEAEALQLISRQGEQRMLGRLSRQRAAKIASLPGRLINRHVSVAFSTEMAGTEGLNLLDVENIQEANGCVAFSPAATAYFLLNVRQDPNALAWLNKIVVNGAVPYTTPIDVFEYGWVLWNLSLAGILDEELIRLCQPHLNALESLWIQGKGIAAVGGLSLQDGDTTAMAYDTLLRLGRRGDLSGVLYYEQGDHFRCFALESNPSLSTNVHVLGALRQAGYGAQHPTIQKILSFLAHVQTKSQNGAFWFDKWHASPYYTTSHAVIECAEYANELVRPAVDWIIKTQNADGSWGFYMPTAEETAYCLQALSIWKRQENSNVPAEILKRGADWLVRHKDLPYPMLWIGKCLYCPELVVSSAILCALALVEQTVSIKFD